MTRRQYFDFDLIFSAERSGYSVRAYSQGRSASHEFDFPFDLLSDTDQSLAKAFGAFNPEQFIVKWQEYTLQPTAPLTIVLANRRYTVNPVRLTGNGITGYGIGDRFFRFGGRRGKELRAVR